ncbi:acanthoscurrin-2-like [Planococcus citri]|uniref:acanthoscurrin-2-like n=1 Tax=Planococcus citri TaxID=170843 RepID=UPI0031F84423
MKVILVVFIAVACLQSILAARTERSNSRRYIRKTNSRNSNRDGPVYPINNLNRSWSRSRYGDDFDLAAFIANGERGQNGKNGKNGGGGRGGGGGGPFGGSGGEGGSGGSGGYGGGGGGGGGYGGGGGGSGRGNGGAGGSGSPGIVVKRPSRRSYEYDVPVYRGTPGRPGGSGGGPGKDGAPGA